MSTFRRSDGDGTIQRSVRECVLDITVSVTAVLGDTVEHLSDPVSDLFELRDPEVSSRDRRAAGTDTRGHRRLFGIERDAVLVAGDTGALEGRLCDSTRQRQRGSREKKRRNALLARAWTEVAVVAEHRRDDARPELRWPSIELTTAIDNHGLPCDEGRGGRGED
jgi:hypothetical protein